MFLELTLALLIGVLAGTITGLTPGIHINLVAAILLSSILLFSKINPLVLSIFVVSMAITHTFLDFIPSIFLGAPDEDTFLSVLPGHQMLKEGNAHEAVILTLYGSLAALGIILIFTPVFIYLIPLIADSIKPIIPFLLIFVSLYLIFREEYIVAGLCIFILSGFLGFFALNLPVKDPLLPLLSGMFGSSALIISIKNKTKLKPQKIIKLKDVSITKKEFFKSTISSIISAPLCSFLPGIGSGHAAVIGSEFIKQSNKGFLILVGGINTIIMGLSFVVVYSIGKTRTGAAAAVKEILKELSLKDLGIIIAAVIISGILSFVLGIYLSKFFSKYITKINYQKLSIIILIILTFFIILFSNLIGLIIFITSTALGIFAILSGTRRINLMGCLLIPTILFYLF